jgi:hypothetical protein
VSERVPSKGERRAIQARKVAEHLDSLGEHKMAQDIRDLCRSYSGVRLIASTLHQELEETRRAAGMPTWERSK